MSHTIHPRSLRRTKTPDQQLTLQRQDVPDDPVPLQQGWLACRSCGIAVSTSDLIEEIQVTSLGGGAAPAAGRCCDTVRDLVGAGQRQRRQHRRHRALASL